jgi:hypothetical protein
MRRSTDQPFGLEARHQFADRAQRQAGYGNQFALRDELSWLYLVGEQAAGIAGIGLLSSFSAS